MPSAVVLSVLWASTSPCVAAEEAPKFKIKVTGPEWPSEVGDDFNLSLGITVSTESEGNHTFLLGSLPQVFGVYILGPWGPIQPDLTKIRPENWMHQEHSKAIPITVTKDKPYTTTIKLRDYFPTRDTAVFKPGAYQVNVKFRAIDLKMAAPIDSGPVKFEIVPKP
jgi:hypothetical protein